jgi:hypothetical protein
MYPTLLKDALDLFRGDQWARRIMDSNVFCSRGETIQAGADGILAMLATGNDRPNLFEIFSLNDSFDLITAIFACDNNDLADGPRALKRAHGMRDDRPAGDRRKQFVKTHATTVTGGDDDGCKHDRDVIC